ncbi:sigma-70 family RNA polymerase sigma factor [Novosphingobium sp. PASSN1]|uniref:sigma-70 family RNA polymerase sigma factor n=1 Tax=Novosphingobium sp. PASSN1 TaxID=2015561 RepID=UPI000BCBFA5F|nr:sigma-70 family RNA polymerase sigma factor [Novosphingobium sp. PASSN1]OYU33578.1 MAG: RNA polymerase subunit sigma-24 [Novosphingobium sp. PASSN1]
MAGVLESESEVDPPRGACLSDSDFQTELTESTLHLRAFARSLCGNRDTADDLTQETLMRAWAARERFAAGTSFKAWTFTILRNVYFGQIRRLRFVGEYNEVEAERVLSTPATQEAGLEASDVLRAMALLPAAQREVLILAAVGDVSYREMAEICGVAVGTIKSRIARARISLAATIESGILPDCRHDYIIKGEVLDAFAAELAKIAPQHVMDRRHA